MLVFLNGKFVPEEQAAVSIFDRSFSLGDGLFEALLFFNSKLFLWEKHFKRLEGGAEFLKIKVPFSPASILGFAEDLMQMNQMTEGVLRLQLSRGVGARGYSTRGANSPTLVLTLHPARKIYSPAQIIVSSIRVSVNDPLSRFKTCSKLSHVLARAEADDLGADEALLFNTDGHVAEATSSNFFWIEGETVCTSPISSGALPGATREFILEICRESKITTVEKNLARESLAHADAAFLTSSGVGVCEISHVEGREFPRSATTMQLRDAYLKYVKGAN